MRGMWGELAILIGSAVAIVAGFWLNFKVGRFWIERFRLENRSPVAKIVLVYMLVAGGWLLFLQARWYEIGKNVLWNAFHLGLVLGGVSAVTLSLWRVFTTRGD